MSNRFAEKVAIITGAARGLGASHARAFAKEGAKVVVTDIGHEEKGLVYQLGTDSEMQGVVKEIEASGGEAIGITCDVSKAKDVEKMVSQVMDRFGKIDILVNNAGLVTKAVPIWETSEENWDLTMNVMLKGTFLCCKYVLPHMVKQRYGKIVNTSSVGAKGQRHNGPYGAAKAGIERLTLSIAKDVGEYNINVNAVAPGNTHSPMVEGVAAHFAKDQGIAPEQFCDEVVKRMSILGRWSTPEDISNTVLFLCSEEARNIDGLVIYVDGGLLNL